MKEGAVEPLLHALNGLFRQVSDRNRELLLLNQTLEARVAQRTEELALPINNWKKSLSRTYSPDCPTGATPCGSSNWSGMNL